MRVLVSLTTMALLSSVGFAQAPVPQGGAPKFGLASAIEKDGKVVVEVFELREVMRMKLPKGGDVFIEKRHWLQLTTGVVGKDIRAYRSDGRPAEPNEVLKALVKPCGVAYYLGFDKAKPMQPDPFYLGMLREGSIVLAFERPELALPVPPAAKP